MSNSSIPITIDLVFNLISIVFDIFALLTCFIFFCVIIYRVIRIKNNRRLIITDVSLILSINIICVIFIKSSLQIIHISIPTLMKDFQLVIDFKETPLCRYRAYIFNSIIAVLFWNNGLLAFFSFARVIYPRKLWLHRSSIYLYVFIPGGYLCVFIGLLPLLFFFDSLHQIPNEAYCGVPSIPVFPSLYTSTISFFLPINGICVFYIFIGRKMKQISPTRQNHEMTRRDFIVIRRMLFNIVILSILLIPYMVLFIISLFKNNFGSIMYGVQWLLSSVGSCLFSTTLPLISTRLRDFLRPNRLAPGNC